ncbi:MAG TPA: hypothetical protein VI685_22340, partial [Candidatus Angelobacter sp.]
MPIILLGLIGLILETLLLIILIKRRLYGRFRAFFVYSAWTLCAMGLRLAAGNHPVAFFLIYWLTEISYFVLAFFAMLSILRPFAPFSGRGWPILLTSACATVTGLSVCALLFKSIDNSALGRFASAIYVFVPLMCLLEMTLLIAAFLMKRKYSIEWTRYEAGILAGFGLLAFMTMFARLPGLFTVFHYKVGPQFEALFRYFPSGAFISSAIAWLIVFWRAEDPPSQEPPDADKLRELARLIRERTEILKQAAKRLGHNLAAAGSTPGRLFHFVEGESIC